MNPSYIDLFNEAVNTGARVPSRHGPTRELLNKQVSFLAGELVTRKGLNYKLGWMEVLQLIAETFDVDAIKLAAPKAQHDLFTPQMAYGLRLNGQLRTAQDRLIVDPLTRQAVVFIGRSQDKMTNALTCTLSMHFMQRDGYLHSTVTMRSWDIVKGLAYDVMMFGAVNLMLSRALHLTPGVVTVNAASAHVYEADMTKQPSAMEHSFDFAPQLQTLSQFRHWAYGQILAFKQSPDRWPNGTPSGIYVERNT